MAQDHSPITRAPCVLRLAFRRHIYYSLTITSIETSIYNTACNLSEFKTKTPYQNLARITRPRDYDWFITRGVNYEGGEADR